MRFSTLVPLLNMAVLASTAAAAPPLPVTHELDMLHKRANENKLAQLKARMQNHDTENSCTFENIAIRRELWASFLTRQDCD